jgi:hypothetical protein
MITVMMIVLDQSQRRFGLHLVSLQQKLGRII